MNVDMDDVRKNLMEDSFDLADMPLNVITGQFDAVVGHLSGSPFRYGRI